MYVCINVGFSHKRNHLRSLFWYSEIELPFRPRLWSQAKQFNQWLIPDGTQHGVSNASRPLYFCYLQQRMCIYIDVNV